MLGLGLGVTFPRPAGGAPTWTPADLPGVTIWLPPPQGDGVSVVSGGVAQWYNALEPGVTDGGAYQSQSAAYPRLQASPPALLSDSGEYMLVRPIAGDSGPWWIGMSFKLPDAVSGFVAAQQGGSTGSQWFFSQNQINNLIAFYPTRSDIDITASRFVSLILVVTATDNSLYYNGSLVDTATSTVLLPARAATFAISAGFILLASASEQTFYSVVAGTGALSDDDRGLLSDYLQGVQS